ncbi:MAG: YihY/virulence factor BrkB family protein [Hyphomicrobiaceae bacterium]|nr:YihY/virulence factor BrkB family protein [Hyphomicrobiaceae bacterium]
MPQAKTCASKCSEIGVCHPQLARLVDLSAIARPSIREHRIVAETSSTRTLLHAIYRLYEHSQLSMAGAVAFSFVVSLFPFCILMGALAGILFSSSHDVAAAAIERLFQILPKDVANGLAPQVTEIMTKSRIDLMTLGGAITLFFATSAVETLRAAMNYAYRVRETRPYLLCLALSMLHVFVTAAVLLVLAWTVLVAPGLAKLFRSPLLESFMNWSWVQNGLLYGISAGVIALELFTLHLWLAAGKRSVREAAPGVALTLLLWIALAGLYSYYLGFSNYSRFYAGLSQLMIALIFFQLTAAIIILGAELNRGLMELKKMRNGNGDLDPAEIAAMPFPSPSQK